MDDRSKCYGTNVLFVIHCDGYLDVSIEGSTENVEIFDTAIAIMAGLMIIPAVFSFSGGDMETLKAGPSLMFITIPKVFASMGLGTGIGIIFFLLVFFMMNSLQTVAQKALSVQLPQATSASAPAQLPVVLTLDAEGHITIDNKPMSIDDAEAMVKQRIQENPNASVILKADKRAAHGQVVAIMDMLKQSGVKRLAIAAEQKG